MSFLLALSPRLGYCTAKHHESMRHVNNEHRETTMSLIENVHYKTVNMNGLRFPNLRCMTTKHNQPCSMCSSYSTLYFAHIKSNLISLSISMRRTPMTVTYTR